MPEGKQFLNPTPPDYSRDFVRPLCETENEFLQVLVTNFRIRKKGRGIELSVAFGRDTPAIWLRQAKAHLLEHLPADRRVFYQSWFEELLVQREAARIIIRRLMWSLNKELFIADMMVDVALEYGKFKVSYS